MTVTPNAMDVLVGIKVRWWRIERGVTTLFNANALNIDVAEVFEGEAGRRCLNAEKLFTLCSLLQITPAEIYADRGPRLVS